MWVRRWEAELIESLKPHAHACIGGTESSKIENGKATVFLMVRTGPDSKYFANFVVYQDISFSGATFRPSYS
jgi:hypothetical protein